MYNKSLHFKHTSTVMQQSAFINNGRKIRIQISNSKLRKPKTNLRIVCREYNSHVKLPKYEEVNCVPDYQKEYMRSRVCKRVFTEQRWASHRSTKRYGRHLMAIVRSRIFKALIQPVGYLTGIALMLSVYETLCDFSLIPASFCFSLDVQIDPFNLTSFALALLLVFRTNTSYSRWEQGHVAWEQIAAHSRGLIRESCVWLRSNVLQEKLGLWTCVFVHCLMSELREDVDLEYQIEDLLSPKELQMIMKSNDKASTALQVLSNLVESEQASVDFKCQLFVPIRELENSLIRARRILMAPIPQSYTRHTTRFLMIWLAFLPFSLWHEIHWFTAPATAITAFLLLGIDELGVQIEEPFSILPLEHYCNRIECGVREILSLRNSVQSTVMKDGVWHDFVDKEFGVSFKFQSQIDAQNEFLKKL
eukprot:TRINITY_DN370_c0_g2_i1.p1 TRINITY_DN370_c0_g2~~TRINITY_DN370_c0_g2_i1.p1  ORF type:complete len:451 (-),score=15.42 TRINITY_DN370_c0_g2_i1:1767-3026(-)